MQRLKKYQIDLHGLTREDAQILLRSYMDSLPKNCYLVEVVHGIGNGIIKEMVHEFHHSRIKERQPSISNPGQTIYYL